MNLPASEPYMEGHNTWCVNRPGSLLLIPVADIAQTLIAILCFIAQNGACITDDINGQTVPGLEAFAGLVNLEEPCPLTFLEQYALTESTAELTTSCYAGMLMLQAMGLGEWVVRWDRPPHHPRSERRSCGSGARPPLRRRRAMGPAESDGPRRRVRRLLPSALRGHASGRRRLRRAEVRPPAAPFIRIPRGPGARAEGYARPHRSTRMI